MVKQGYFMGSRRKTTGFSKLLFIGDNGYQKTHCYGYEVHKKTARIKAIEHLNVEASPF